IAERNLKPLPHLFSRFVGVCDCKKSARVYAVMIREDLYAGYERARLSRSGSGQDEPRPRRSEGCATLRLIEIGQKIHRSPPLQHEAKDGRLARILYATRL